MHLESRCYSSSAINKQTDSSQESTGHAATTASTNINRTWSRTAKKDKTATGAGIFSFFQKFRVSNNRLTEVNGVADSRFSLGSPQSSRYSLASVGTGAGRRWESIESVISSATATSFAFIPPHQLRQFNYPRPPPPKLHGALDREKQRSNSRLDNGNRLPQQRRYRLATNENRSTAASSDCKDIASVKRLNRNSTGNIDNFWIPSDVNCVTAGSVASHDTSTLIIPNKRKRCYRPGKRKAPQPPSVLNHLNGNDLSTDNESKVINGDRRINTRIHYEDDDDEYYENDENRVISIVARKPATSYRKKKKRQAPLPPRTMNNDHNNADQAVQHQSSINVLSHPDPKDDEPVTYCNDSLKLEKGILKANKHSVEITNKSDSPKLASPSSPPTPAVSPKPWYKRSCVKVNTHNNLSSFREKRNSCRKDEMDQWMLESGIARFRRTDDDIFKRHSQISVLANISELDRQASEILEKQRKQQRDAINNAEAKFYSDLMENDQAARKERFNFNESTSCNAKKNKDLISILNNFTSSVSKIGVHSGFASKPTSREGNDNDDVFLASGSSSSSVNKLAERSRYPMQSSNLLANKNKKPMLKIGEIFEKNHRNIRKKDDKKILNKSSSSFETINDTKLSPLKEKRTQITATDALIPIKPNREEVSTQNELQQIPRPVQKPFSSWSCPQCNSENPSWKFICEKCKKWRPYSVSSRTTDQRYFVDFEKENSSKKSNTNNITKQKDDSIQKIHLNVKNSVATDQKNDYNNFKLNKIKYDDLNSQRNAQRREFYSSIAAASVSTEKLDTSSLNTSSSPTNNLNGAQQMKSQINQTLQYYNDQDRKMLCDILKELKNSLSSSRRGRLAIEADEKIINKVDSIISSPSSSSVENTSVPSTSGTGNIPSTKSSSAINSPNVTRSSNLAVANNAETNATNPGPGRSLRTKQEENDDADENDAFQFPQNERKHINESKLTAVENNNVPVLAINRLLKKLQTAIANGQHHEAANIARELARLKVSCHMTRRGTSSRAGSSNLKTENTNSSAINPLNTFVVSVYIKEPNHNRGPIPLQIHNTTTVEQLKLKLSDEFKIPAQRQQWRSEKLVLNDETAVLYDLGIDQTGIPLYVYLTKDEGKPIPDKEINENITADPLPTDKNTADVLKVLNNESTTDTGLQNVRTDLQFQVSNLQLETPNDEIDILELQNDNDNVDIETDEGNLEVNDRPVDDIPPIITTPAKRNASNERQTPSPEIPNETDDNRIPTGSLPISGWQCTLCTLINETHTKFCAACGEQRVNANENNIPDINDLASTSQQNYNHAPWRTAKRDHIETNNNHETEKKDEKKLYYQELIDLEKNDLITNTEHFECSICLMECEQDNGVVLRDCLHTFCKDCLQQTVQFSTEAQVKCPFGNATYSCDSVLQEREIKALVDADTYEKHLARSLSEAQNKIKNAFHCKTPNCAGWCIYEDNVNEFHCPVCRKTNCLTCQVIHGGLNCKQYQEMTRKESENNADTSKTRNMLEEMVEKGEAMVCPTCDIILMKKWGCDWLRCSMCKTEICWVTRGPRWGPAGKGDTTAGCRCGVNGVKCHPKCNYCH
ncbi:uncharacterized protein LOC135839453 [Planococcus citri]|uniref:uncharacterized protein LOC135839453 n=1 Tax=Planococcus citri TaxID=170843 RepID=UPI0031F79A13